MSQLVKITEMTGKYDISARTLRYYEDMGLITSVRNDDYAYRMYDEAAVKRLEQILILRRLNICIRDIQRVFDAPGSQVVLEVLGNKVNDIDAEVALLHELKEVILEFVREIRDVDFSRNGDVKLLYEKAMQIETQLANVDDNGKSSNVNRLLAVTQQLERSPHIIRKLPHFYEMFHVSDSTRAFELYHQVFGAEKISEDVLTNGDVYILMEVNGFQVLIRPGEMPNQGCCVYKSMPITVMAGIFA